MTWYHYSHTLKAQNPGFLCSGVVVCCPDPLFRTKAFTAPSAGGTGCRQLSAESSHWSLCAQNHTSFPLSACIQSLVKKGIKGGIQRPGISPGLVTIQKDHPSCRSPIKTAGTRAQLHHNSTSPSAQSLFGLSPPGTDKR